MNEAGNGVAITGAGRDRRQAMRPLHAQAPGD
jgi:hypothetical protein